VSLSLLDTLVDRVTCLLTHNLTGKIQRMV